MVAHSDILLSKCAQFRDEGQFIDVRLKVGEDIFPAHRIVLAANSDYFHAMFTDGMKESNREVIELKDESISPDALKIVMDSIYTGDVRVNEENVFEILAVADHLQVRNVAKLCCDFILIQFVQLRFDVQTYCRVWTIAARYGLKDLQEEAEKKMAAMYRQICESEEFLSHFGAGELASLLSREDLNAPSETFVFKSAMQWIKHKKEERMAVAAKVIGAVRLGLVDIKVVIQELNTEEMQQDPEIRMLLQESLLHSNMPSHNSKFAIEKAKARSISPVLVGITQNITRSKELVQDTDGDPEIKHKIVVQYFDAEAKMWKRLQYDIAQLGNETQSLFCAEYFGNYLYVAGKRQFDQFVIGRYDVANNSWETLPPFFESNHQINCLCAVDDYIYAISESNPPQRYSLGNNNWQKGAEFARAGDGKDLIITYIEDKCFRLNTVTATVLKSKIYVVHGCQKRDYVRENRYHYREVLRDNPAVMHCFDPAKNKWEHIAFTCRHHFGSSLFIVNNSLCLAGGNCSCDLSGKPKGDPAVVEVYKEETNTWSVIKQKHIPQNNLGAVEIEGKVYFIINKFPIDSGIRIPPEEMYHIHLDEWENLAQVRGKAVLCYLPVKRESLKREHDEIQTD